MNLKYFKIGWNFYNIINTAELFLSGTFSTGKMGRKYGIYKLMCFETENLFEFAMKGPYGNHKGYLD